MATRLDHVPIVMLVEDNDKARSEMKEVLELSGYRVIDADNGQDATKRARYAHPDLVVVDLDEPLLRELATARQIVRQAQLGTVPVVVVTHQDGAEPYPMLEAGIRRNEYVTSLSDYEQLEHLLDYLLPGRPSGAA